MHCFRDAPSLHQFLCCCPSHELRLLLHDQLAALADCDDVPLGDLTHFFILEPQDSTSTLEIALRRNLVDIPIETCVSHAEWFELVIIVSDDGFGYVVFIPKDTKDHALVDFCTLQAIRTQENSS